MINLNLLNKKLNNDINLLIIGKKKLSIIKNKIKEKRERYVIS